MEVVTQADSMIAAKAATVARSKNIGSPPCLLVPAAVADALMTLLTYVIARNARDPAMMAAALGRNLALAVDDDDDEEAEPLPN